MHPSDEATVISRRRRRRGRAFAVRDSGLKDEEEGEKWKHVADVAYLIPMADEEQV